MLKQDILALAKNTSVLYVEDEDATRNSIALLFERLFREVLLATNGKEGLDIYRQKRPDLIITDVTMPVMDGFQMIESIRENDLDQKVIVISAHGDSRFLQRAINLRVNGYVMKPVMQDSLLNSITDALELLWSKRQLEELNSHLEERVRQEVEKNRQKDTLTIQMLEQVLEAYPNPTIVYEASTIRYINQALGAMVQKENYADLVGRDFDISQCFLQEKGSVHQLKDLRPGDTTPKTVSIKTTMGRKIYLVLVRELNLHGTPHVLYTFNDITLPEYQKIKIAQYTEFLEEFVFTSRSQKTPEVATPEPAPARQTPASSPATPKKQAELDQSLNDKEKNVLRKSHSEKVTAQEFVADIGEEILYELYELEELEEDIDIALEQFAGSPHKANLERVSSLFSKYASTMSLIFEFSDLSYAITSLSSILRNVEMAQLDDRKIVILKTYLKAIREDLQNWRTTIFVTRESKDIHYLDSSLFSSCLQIEYTLSGKEEEQSQEEDDLDIFF